MDKHGLSADAGTHRIEYCAESVIDLDIENDTLEDSEDEKWVTLRVVKNRNGTAGQMIPLRFHDAHQRGREVD